MSEDTKQAIYGQTSTIVFLWLITMKVLVWTNLSWLWVLAPVWIPVVLITLIAMSTFFVGR